MVRLKRSRNRKGAGGGSTRVEVRRVCDKGTVDAGKRKDGESRKGARALI